MKPKSKPSTKRAKSAVETEEEDEDVYPAPKTSHGDDDEPRSTQTVKKIAAIKKMKVLV
jgi:hypothetical protein